MYSRKHSTLLKPINGMYQYISTTCILEYDAFSGRVLGMADRDQGQLHKGHPLLHLWMKEAFQ